MVIKLMKNISLVRFLRVITITLVVPCTTLTSFGQDCEKSIEKLKDVLKTYRGNEFYMKLGVHTESKQGHSDTVYSQIWSSGNRFKMKAEYLTILKDEFTQVMIIEDEKLIILNDGKSEGTTSTTPLVEVDSLLKFSPNQTCKKTKGTLSVKFEFDESVMKHIGQSSIEFIVSIKTNRLLKIVAEKQKGKVWYTEVTDIKSFTRGQTKGRLAQSSESVLFVNGELKKEYKGYRIQDLRTSK